MDGTAEGKINKLLVKCDKCEVECTVKRYRKLDCLTGHQGIDMWEDVDNNNDTHKKVTLCF